MSVDKIPLTPGGKVDRKNLPAPGSDDLISDSMYIEARNQIENETGPKSGKRYWVLILSVPTIISLPSAVIPLKPYRWYPG